MKFSEYKYFLFLSFCILISISCGKSESLSRNKYLIFDDQEFFGLMHFVKQDTIKICLNESGSSVEDDMDTVSSDEDEDSVNSPLNRTKKANTKGDNMKDWIKESVLAWIGPIRTITRNKLAEKVEVTCSGEPHGMVDVAAESGRAHMMPGENPQIQLYADDGYRVLLHEMGHAFGLDDTYIEGVFSCKPGQPDSVMCTAAFEKPQNDDIKGIRAIYKKLFGDEGVVEQEEAKMFLALEKRPGASEEFKIYANATKPLKPESVKYCLGEQGSCQEEGSWQNMQTIELRKAGRVFSSSNRISLEDELVITVSGKTSNNNEEVIATAKFSSKS